MILSFCVCFSCSLSIQQLWWISGPSSILMGSWRKLRATTSVRCSSNQTTSSLSPTSTNSGMSCRNRAYELLELDVLLKPLQIFHLWTSDLIWDGFLWLFSAYCGQMLVELVKTWTGLVKMEPLWSVIVSEFYFSHTQERWCLHQTGLCSPESSDQEELSYVCRRLNMPVVSYIVIMQIFKMSLLNLLLINQRFVTYNCC